MKRPLALVLLAVLLAAGLGSFFLLRGNPAPAPGPVGGPETPVAAAPTAGAGANQDPVAGPTDQGQRVALPTGRDQAEEDPEIRAALSGFKGRVVDHGGKPVARTGVQIYRFALDSMLRPGIDLMADVDVPPDYVAGEAQTGEDGRFAIHGVWPRAMYLLHAGIGSDAPGHRIIDHGPGPGEVVDLGDVVLDDAAVLTGKVVDDTGAPVAGALVRAADVPGQLASLFPFERFDPDGVLIVRERGGPPSPVIEFPAWVKQAFERFPIPRTVTGEDGSFRLVGAMPGNNLVVTNKAGFLADVKPSVPLKAGQQKDLGTVKLSRGEELTGKVLDTAGRPVAGADVVAGGTVAVAPVDLGVRVGKSDAEGKFRADGLPKGRVTVAARRGKGHPWVVAEPQQIATDVVVTLPAVFSLTVAVTGRDGAPATAPRLRLLAGRESDGLMVMGSFGFLPGVDLTDATTKLPDGRLRIEHLQTGQYTLLAQEPGSAIAQAQVQLTQDAEVALTLTPAHAFVVQVLDPEQKPLRSAMVYYQERGEKSFDLPMAAGRTGPDGKRSVDTANTPSIRVSATHPKYGTAHAEGAEGKGDIVVRMAAPGVIEGVVLELGAPPKPGKWSVVVMHWGGGGTFEDPPLLTVPGVDGKFVVKGLQPGNYRLAAIKSLTLMHSLGQAMLQIQGYAMGMEQDDVASAQAEVTAGGVARVELAIGGERYTGPKGHVFGTVTIDGRLAVDRLVSLSGSVRRTSVKTDATGRFDFGLVPAGQLQIEVLRATGDFFDRPRPLWTNNLELKEGEERMVDAVVQTASIRGVVVRADGTPAAGVWINANARFANADGKGEGWAWFNERSGTDGSFHFAQVVAGKYQFDVRGEDGGGRGKLEGVEVPGGQTVEGVRIQLQKQATLKGRVELAAFGGTKPRWIWMGFHKYRADVPPERAWDDQEGGDNADQEGVFTVDSLPPGRYRVRFWTDQSNEQHEEWWAQDEIEVGTTDQQGLVLVPVKRERRR